MTWKSVVLQGAGHTICEAPVVAGLVVKAGAVAGVTCARMELVTSVALGRGDVVDEEAGSAQDLPLGVVVEGDVGSVMVPGTQFA